jgi:type I restriction enzyme M protein
MVVPNGILNNPGLAYVRDWLTTRTQILGIVDMQRDLFQPHNDTPVILAQRSVRLEMRRADRCL